MYVMTLTLPHAPQDTLIEVDGLGVYGNGRAHFISAAQADEFSARKQRVETSYDKQGRMTSVIVPGPSLEEYFASNDHVNIKPSAQQGSSKTEENKGDDE